MKKSFLRKYGFAFIVGLCSLQVVLFFITDDKKFSLFCILTLGSYLFEQYLPRFSRSPANFSFSLVGSTVHYLILGFLWDFGFKDGTIASVFDIINVITLIGLLFLVVWFSIQAFKKSPSVISGAIMLLNITLIYALLYDAINCIDPLAFSGTSGFCAFPFLEFIYYSIVTFTTLGYGDIVPVSIVAKLLSASEAFIFTCMIAFVVMNFGTQMKQEKKKELPKDTLKKASEE